MDNPFYKPEGPGFFDPPVPTPDTTLPDALSDARPETQGAPSPF
jgi:hypothetical protein